MAYIVQNISIRRCCAIKLGGQAASSKEVCDFCHGVPLKLASEEKRLKKLLDSPGCGEGNKKYIGLRSSIFLTWRSSHNFKKS